MASYKLKLDNNFVHLRIFDEKNECIAEAKGSVRENKKILEEIGKSYGYCFTGLKDLIFFLESPKTITKALLVGYDLTKDR